MTAVASATRLAAANSRLQAEVRARVAELEASRRRILDARDDERRRLERRLHDGAEQRLDEVSGVLRSSRPSASGRHEQENRPRRGTGQAIPGGAGPARPGHPPARPVRAWVAACLVHPSSNAFLSASRSTIDTDGLPPPVEAAAYFVCAEALANVVKYASASRVRVSVIADEASVRVVVEDDGIGGADPARGSGLRGLADRVATLGGRFGWRVPAGHGTRLAAEIPLGGEDLRSSADLDPWLPRHQEGIAGSIGSAGSRVRLPSSSRVNLYGDGR